MNVRKKDSHEELWTAVDDYLTDVHAVSDPVLTEALAANAAADLPCIDITGVQGKFLWLLARIGGARRILEIGTLGGYSTIWLARALPEGGRLTTLEVNPVHAEVALGNISRAGLAHLVDLRVGPALETLPKLEAEADAPFDFIFIDADKPNITEYVGLSLKISRPGTVIVVDNVIRDGAVIDRESADPDVQGVRGFLDSLPDEPRLTATTIQTVGGKGYDGFTIATVTD